MHKFKNILLFFVISYFCMPAQSWMGGMDPLHLDYEKAKYKVDSITAYQANIRGMGIKMFNRWAYENRFHLNASDYISSRQSVYNNFQAYKANRNVSASRSELPQWWPLGPFDWTAKGETQANNPGMGRINAVRVASYNEDVIFVATAGGGIWKSEDGGAHWNTTTDTLGIMAFSDIAIHPTDSNIVYAASGDRDGLDIYGMGIYKSEDGGLSWKQTSLNRTKFTYNYTINRLLISETNPNKVYACSPKGVYKTEDAGENWDLIYEPGGGGFAGSFSGENIMNIMFHPTDSNTIYAVGSDYKVTYDGGETWENQESGLLGNIGRCEVGVSAADPDRVYVLVADADYNYDGVYRSDDKGKNFYMVTDPDINVLGYSLTGDDDRSQAFYDLGLAVNPEDADEFFTAGINIWTSTNGGVTMKNMTDWHYNSQPDYCHADVHHIHFKHGRFWLASDGGIFVSDDKGQSWNDLSEGLVISQFYALELDTENNRILAGSQDNAFSYYRNESYENIWEGDGFICKFSPDDTATFYVATQYGHIWKTEDNGDHFDYAYPAEMNGEWMTPYQIDAEDPNILIAGYNEIYRSEDGGLSWDVMTSFNESDNFEVLEIANSNPDYIYASKGGLLYFTKDGGVSWASTNLSGVISSILIHPSNPDRIYLTFGSNRTNKVNVSFDGGLTFENLSDSLPNLDAFTIAYESGKNGRLYLGMEIGAYYLDSTMTGWQPFMNGLPEARVVQIKVDETNGIMRASVYGRGLWQAHLDGNVGVEELNGLSQMQFKAYPNIIKSNTVIQLELEDRIDGELLLWGLNGRKIKSYPFNQSGKIEWSLSMQGLASGAYFVSLNADERIMKTIKLIKE